MRCFKRWTAGGLLLAACFVLPAAWAHKSSDAYLMIDTTRQPLQLRWDIALRDLDAALDLDRDGDGQLSWGEIQAQTPRMVDYATARLALDGCPLQLDHTSLERRNDGVYLALFLHGACAPETLPPIRYTLFADIDPTHRGLASILRSGQPPLLRMLDPGAPAPPPAAAPITSAGWAFLREGVHHILSGYDHLLFLLCLILPSVMARHARRYRPLPHMTTALLPVAGIVSAFTLAHSITLGLGAAGVLAPPPALVEAAIAATIVLAALDNLVPIFPVPRAGVAFLFGLIHGFGFAGALAELHLPTLQYIKALVEFNLGLELGQLLIVALAMLLLFCLRRSAGYVPVLLRGGSAGAMLIGSGWLAERLGLLTLPSF
ncbi:HupE/UreJ family protein [Pseudoduganella sp. FT25W]|uniref:HupE/UreJ family protein n=2 Tax=Duganella alba TaxID=2666081 RepID=A0A6L5QPX3_9BURK|nr:HupE/UreJ family protein [Duganella alba]MRX20246.1 HupE/UreJ family protein [Duganella alba]